MSRDSRSSSKILVIHFGQLGDVVLALPAMRAIRRHFDSASITALVGKAAAEIVTMSRVADRVVPVDRVELRDGNRLRSITAILRLVRDTRRERYDLVIDLHSLSETNLLGFVARIPRRLYANRENRSLDRLGNISPRPPVEDKSKHVAARYFDVLAPLGIDNELEPFFFDELPFDGDAGEIDGSVAIFPGAGHASRCWPLERFADLARRLTAAGERVIVFLGPEETRLRDAVTVGFPPATTIVEGLTLPQFVAALGRVRLFICNDTGPMHLAACAGTEVVLLMDQRAPVTYLPLSRKLTVVRHGELADITVNEVFDAVENVLRTGK